MSQPDDKMGSGLTPSSGALVLWSFLLTVMISVAYLNFTLLAGLMAGMVGGQNLILGIASEADASAAVVVILEIFMGVFFLETLSVTKLFSEIHALKTSVRARLRATTIFLLSMFALIEAGLVWMHDAIVVQEGIALRHDLFGQLPLSAQMAVAFVLPFILILAGLSFDRVVRMLRGQSV